jgi:hypothetical protein
MLVGLLALAGCGSSATTNGSGADGSGAGPTDNGFVSDNPQGSGYYPGGEDAGGDTSSGTGTGGEVAPPPGDDPERAIIEADIIQLQGNYLYALSQFGGLSIIDVSQPDALELVGRYTTAGMPFEMYLRDGTVYAMFDGWGQYVYDAAVDSYSWVQSSRIEALDVSNPAVITKLGSYDLPGSISDSRMVGDVLYTVTFEDGYCWNCQSSPNTTITSFAVGDPASMTMVDHLTFNGDDPWGYGWWRRSVTVTEDRMYVAGIEWDGGDEGSSTIQVVDISDPAGELVLGASVEAAGQIESRWQMDEHEGILRVISQPGVWWSNGTPRVQTFAVASSSDVTPLGSLDLVLPMPERLRAVRFDGPRAYAITAVQTDPLFTIDVTNPAAPVQLAALELPGFIYHIEPRGDRLYTLGFDNTNPEGSLHVSLFDVSDMSAPVMLERVAFGGDWSSLAEDQDRIHKAFKLVDDLGLLLVPFAAWSYDDQSPDGWGCAKYEGGVQLIDFTTETLLKRGVAEMTGFTRRAFVHGARLFAVSEAEVASFDVADRDAPLEKDALALSTNVNQTVVVGNNVARLATDWWTGEAKLDVVPKADPGAIEPIGTLDMSALAGADDACYGWSYYGARAFANGSHLYLVRSDYSSQSFVDVVDLANPAAPAHLAHVALPYNMYGWGWYGGIVTSGDVIVQVGSKLVFRDVTDDYDPATLETGALGVVDLSDPANPEVTIVTLPAAQGYTNLVASGSDVLTSHWVPLPGDASKVKFYTDRVDVGSGSLESSINVPGSLLSVDAPTGRVLTIDYKKNELLNVSWEECYDAFGWDAIFTSDDGYTGDCARLEKTFKLVDVDGTTATLIASSALGQMTYLSSVLLGDDRVFASYYDYSEDVSATTLLAIGGMRSGTIQQQKIVLDPGRYDYPAEAMGKKLVTGSYYPTAISVLDTTDLDAPTYETKGELPSYLYDVTLSGETALCSMGPWGIATVDVGD